MTSSFLGPENDLNEPFKGCTSLSINDFSELCEHFENNGLAILHLNIRGCRTNFSKFSSLLSSFNTNFACIALTETNITTSNIDVDFNIKGYKCVNLYAGQWSWFKIVHKAIAFLQSYGNSQNKQ